MRFLILDGLYFKRRLLELGHDVLSIGQGPGHDLHLERHLSLKGLMAFLDGRGFRPDVVLWCDLCHPPLVAGFESLPALTVGFSVDQYLNPWHVPYSAAFDLMLVAQKDYLRLFEHKLFPRPVEWFPLFCDQAGDLDPGLERDVPVSFVGTLDGSINVGRKAFFERFKKLHPIFVASGDYRPVFARSRIVLNQSAAGELNFRLFQASACGAAVLNEDVGNGLLDVFTPGENLLPPYAPGDAADAARIAAQWLARPRELARLAQAGRNLVLAEHSAAARVDRLLARVRQLMAAKAWKWRRENAGIVRRELFQCFTFLAADTDLALPEPHRAFYGGLAKTYSEA